MGAILVDWLQAALRYAAPLLLVAVGEVFAERSGVINMGVEGIMLVGALAGVAGAYYLKSLVLAVLITIIVGALMGLVVSYLTVSRRTNQVVTGLMINMLCLGATDMLFSMMSETRTNRCETFPIIFPEFMQNIPVIGKINKAGGAIVGFLITFIILYVVGNALFTLLPQTMLDGWGFTKEAIAKTYLLQIFADF